MGDFFGDLDADLLVLDLLDAGVLLLLDLLDAGVFLVLDLLDAGVLLDVDFLDAGVLLDSDLLDAAVLMGFFFDAGGVLFLLDFGILVDFPSCVTLHQVNIKSS